LLWGRDRGGLDPEKRGGAAARDTDLPKFLAAFTLTRALFPIDATIGRHA